MEFFAFLNISRHKFDTPKILITDLEDSKIPVPGTGAKVSHVLKYHKLLNPPPLITKKKNSCTVRSNTKDYKSKECLRPYYCL